MESIRYVVTLDADTLLPREAARRLIGTLAHVLNRAQFDPATGRVQGGYTIRNCGSRCGRRSSTNRSLPARMPGCGHRPVQPGRVGCVPGPVRDGNFASCVIVRRRRFRTSLHDRIPENRLLSHDLFEALQGRCGLVSDVILYEDYPPHYLAYTDRLHRCARRLAVASPGWVGGYRTGQRAGHAISFP